VTITLPDRSAESNFTGTDGAVVFEQILENMLKKITTHDRNADVAFLTLRKITAYIRVPMDVVVEEQNLL
jgi:hypothetical protein